MKLALRRFGPLWLCASLLLLALVDLGLARAEVAASYAGSATCAECHAAETKAWRASDHGWALREPTSENVLGDFSGVTFTNKDVTSRFFTKDGRYFVETDGADGKPATFEVRFTVGVRPLQQYLVETTDGRLQVLDLAWDADQKKWYHLYPGQEVGHANGLHWTGSYKNWQARCAECHQTGFDKGFDHKSKTYKSHWAELTVSCESCHGEASSHVSWAKKDTAARGPMPAMLKLGPGQQSNEIAVCGPCHARREPFAQMSPKPGTPFADHYNLSLLNRGLYFPDGQQNEEVFILGSFLQSKMKAKGVTCSNCHEPHGNGLVAEGNAVCTQCHNEGGRQEFPTLVKGLYDSEAHTHHKPGTEAAQCVSCHMPERSYMVIDARRDHFFRRPDPLQSKAAGAPDVCTGCHQDKTAEWAATTIAGWFPKTDKSWQSRSAFIAFSAGDTSPKVLQDLADYAADVSRPAIVRATAIDDLRDVADPALKSKLQQLVNDQSELVRSAASGLFRDAEPATRNAALKPLLSDPVRSVRQSAAIEMIGAAPDGLSPEDIAALEKALAEFNDAKLATADMPEAHMAMAGVALRLRNWNAAEGAFRQAVALDPQLDSAWAMLARISAALGNVDQAAKYLEDGLSRRPDSIELMLGSAALESQRGDNGRALSWYRRVVAQNPNRLDAWLGMAYAAIGAQDPAVAIDATNKVLEKEPKNVEAIIAKSYALLLQKDIDGARALARQARDIDPRAQLPPELEGLLR